MLKTCRAAGYDVPREFTGSEGFPNAYVTGPDDLKIELQQNPNLTTIAAAHHFHLLSAPSRWCCETGTSRRLVSLPEFAAGINRPIFPGMNLSFEPVTPQPELGTKGRVLDHIGFEVKNLEAFCKKLEASGIKLDVPV